jgi:hypothetical protein
MIKSGYIILLDGMPGVGKSTFASGAPKPYAVLDTDNDGWRWLREHASVYENTRNIVDAERHLKKWADSPDLGSIIVDTHAQFWQNAVSQVMDDKDRNPKMDMHKTWGAAKISIRRKTHDPYVRAKRAGKIVLLVAHTKDDVRRTEEDGKTKIEREGLKADSEAMLNDIVDVHVRMFWRPKTDEHWLETVKCRPQRDYKPLIPARIEVKKYESQLALAHLLAIIGESPSVGGAPDSAQDDAQTEAAMLEAVQRRA